MDTTHPLQRDEATGFFTTKTKLVTENTRTKGIDNVKTVADAAQVMAYLGNGAVERFDGLVTDKNGKPLAIVGSFKGALSPASVYPSTITGEAFRIKGASYIWFAQESPAHSL